MAKTRKEKIKALREALVSLDQKSGGAFSGSQKDLGGIMESLVRDEGATVRAEVKDRPVIKALSSLSQQFTQLKKDIDIKSIIKAIENADVQNDEKLKVTEAVFDEKLGSIVDELMMAEERGQQFSAAEAKKVLDQLYSFQAEYEAERTSSSSREALTQAEVSRITQELSRIAKIVEAPKDEKLPSTLAQNVADTQTALLSATEAKALIAELEKNTNTRLAALQSVGGGSMNRSIVVGGNPSTLSRYTDINIIPSSNFSVAVRNNDTTKMTEFVMSATGGAGGTPAGETGQVQFNDSGAFAASSTLAWDSNASVLTVGFFRLPGATGSAGQYLLTNGNGTTQWASVQAAGGSGIERVSSIITDDTTGGSTASRDYMYFINEGLRFTLPTAVGNNNLYTLKNMAASSVLVLCSAGQDIDGSTTALLPTQYQSLSLQSNGSVWGVV